jgi:DNA-binding NtrC family response regulator
MEGSGRPGGSAAREARLSSDQRDPAERAELQSDDAGQSSGKHRIAARASDSSETKAGASGRYSVLVVDDDPAVLSSIEAILSFDFNVVSCATPEEALRRFVPGRFHVVCADYVMPGIDGHRLLTEIARRSTAVCCLLMTARVDLEPGGRDFPVMFKPFDPERFVHTVGHLARIADMKRSTRALSEATGRASARGKKS